MNQSKGVTKNSASATTKIISATRDTVLVMQLAPVFCAK
jgi:hypothetical protein